MVISSSLFPLLSARGPSIAIAALMPVVVLSPAGVFGFILHRKKRRYLAYADEPFTDLPLRPPGESLRLEIERLTERFETNLLQLILTGTLPLAFFLTLPFQWPFIVPTAVAVSIGYVYFGRGMVATAEELWKYRLAYMGERVVGEELNQLLAQGFRVFHDIPFENFNIDHVIVGPPGVFIVETKTRRKPSDIKGQPRATVVFDGARLEFPKWTETAAIDQARRNARTAEQWLTKATGEPVTACAILTYPGWWVERKAVSDVNVLNPAEIKYSFREPKRPIAPEQIQRIAHQLTERCRLTTK